MIIADSNLIVSCVIETEATSAAIALRASDSDWRVPRLWRYEVMNIFSTLIKTGRLDREIAVGIYRQLLSVLRAGEQDPEPAEVLRLVEEHAITGYDAQFVALALELGGTLYTQDKEILRKFPVLARRFYQK